MILKKEEGRRNPRAWHGSRLTVSGLHGHPSTPNPRPKRRVETPGDPWGVPQPPGPSSPAYGTPPTANRWFLPLSSSQWGQTLPTTSVMFPVRIEPRDRAQGGKKIPGESKEGGNAIDNRCDSTLLPLNRFNRYSVKDLLMLFYGMWFCLYFDKLVTFFGVSFS